MTTNYIACDLGAESGRVMLGTLHEGKLSLSEVHRFPNLAVETREGLTWDVPGLFQEILVGLRKVGARDESISSVSCDSWGVDYLLFSEDGRMVPPAFHYRDSRCANGMKDVLSRIPWDLIYKETGIQKMPINTLFQLGAETGKRMKKAGKLLSIADGCNYLLSGEARMEVSMASTTQLYNPVERNWSRRLVQDMKLPPDFLPAIVPSGTILGPMLPEMANQTSLRDANVVASCSHDTAAAVVGLPATADNWAFLSSGTWSLMGIELNKPIINDRSRDKNFTNEIGFGNSVRFLKNIAGLWIIQECRRQWADAQQELDYEVMTHLAASSPPFQALINPNDPRFLSPGDMPEKIAAYCKETGQVIPRKPGPIIRCVLESLALLYRRILKDLEISTGQKIERLHLVGGGARNTLLNHFTANAIQLPVVVGPTEATSAGNILVQAIAQGHLGSLAEARQVVQNSLKFEVIQPHAVAWNAAYERLERLL